MILTFVYDLKIIIQFVSQSYEDEEFIVCLNYNKTCVYVKTDTKRSSVNKSETGICAKIRNATLQKIINNNEVFSADTFIALPH